MCIVNAILFLGMSSCGHRVGSAVQPEGEAVGGACQRLGCIMDHGVGMVQEKYALPRDRSRTGGMSFVVIAHGWQRREEVVRQVLLPACALCLLCWRRTCAACWCGMAGPWSAPCAPRYLANSSICVKELPQIFFLGCLILTSLSTVSPLF